MKIEVRDILETRSIADTRRVRDMATDIRGYTLHPYDDPDELRATDLREETEALDVAWEAGCIRIYGPDGHEDPVRAEYLYIPAAGRLGIAWGADATWADVDSLESGVDMWLRDGDEWDRRN